MHATGIEPVAKTLREVYGRLDTRFLKHWRHLAQQNDGIVVETRGKKQAEQFEIDLLSELVYVAAAPAQAMPQALPMLVSDNSMFSYELISQLATLLQASTAWKDHKTVQKLKFSRHWVHSFLQRLAFKKRRITTVHKRMSHVVL